MSRLDKLIAELCPNGVEYKPLEQCCSILDNRRKPVTKAARVSGEYPYYGANGIQDYVSEYIFEGVFILVGEDGSVMTPNGNPVVNWAEGKIWVNNHAHIVEEKEGILLRYLYHFIQTVNVSDVIHGNIPKLTGKDFRAIRVPVPPLEVQREIVRVLDNFTLLTAELTAELTARKKQYAYYRDLLLTINSSVPECSMGEVLTFLNGRAYKQQELLDAGKYPVLRVGNFYTNSSWYYSDLELEKDKYCDKGDLLYSWAATLGPKIWNGGKCIYHYHIWKILFDENIIDKMYLYYYLQYDLSEISKSTTHSTMVHVSMGSMKERKIKIPPLNEQRRIAGLISQFDNLCNSILSGLPAEIDARQKQYEYYRDKLLSFNEMGTEI